jgi:hypothetical protein
MSLRINESIQNILVGFLRYCFTGNEDYLYVPNLDGTTDLDNTQIDVYRKFPKVLTSYPLIIANPPVRPNILRTMGGDFLSSTLGQVDVGEVSTIEGICYSTYGGVGELNFDIDIYGNTSAERDKISDYVVDYIRFSQRSYLEDRAIEVMDVSQSSDNVRPYGAGYIYVNTVSVTLFVEWEENVWNVGDILKEVGMSDILVYSDADGLCNIHV